MKWFIKKTMTWCMISVTSLLLSCPTCVGRLDKNTPTFFSDELYKPHHKKSKKNEPKKENKQPSKNNASSHTGGNNER